MRCDSCKNEAVISQPYSGRHLCHRHLAADLEAKAKRSIRAHHWLATGDIIGVVVTGDKQSGALLHFMKKLTGNRRDVRLIVIPVDECLTCEGDGSTALRIAACLEIAGRESGSTVSGPDTLPQPPMRKGTAILAGLTKIAVANSLEFIGSGVLRMFLQGKLCALPQAFSERAPTIPLIFPFSAIPMDEIELYWDGLGQGIETNSGHRTPDIFSDRIRTLLKDYNTRHPATFHALLHLGEQITGGKWASLAGTSALNPIPSKMNEIFQLPGEVKGNGS
jgi:hypothetical protein